MLSTTQTDLFQGRDDKAQRYIGLLDNARVNGNWSEFPELIRKITKHAPERKTLIATASLEHEIVKHGSGGISSASSAQESSHPFAAPLERLKRDRVSRDGYTTPEEGIQARTCIWWADWVVGSDENVLMASSATPYTEEEDATYSLWTKICIVKAAYIKGSCFASRGSLLEADVALERVIPLLDMNKADIASTAQLAHWSEQLLAEIALMRSAQDTSDAGESAAAAFRHWAQLASKGASSSPSAYGYAPRPKDRLVVWHAYYQHLSSLLQKSRPDDPSVLRTDLVPALRHVESAYENELMRKVQFPKASQSNQIVEEWVEQVIRNWEILGASHWLESVLGDDGRASIGRNLIEILYRAAMKTFQSTLILRRLFQVHKSLADFELAYKALDTYLELIERGRARAAKSGQPAAGQDDDELVLLTMVEGIEGLASFGHQAQAEKAYSLCSKLQSLLQEVDPGAVLQSSERGLVNGDSHYPPTTIGRLSPQSRDLVHRALGIGKANWAKWTPFNEKRSALQLEAISHLRVATSQPLPDVQRVKSAYALGLLLAETREIDPAIEAIKTTLAQSSADQRDGHLVERQLMPSWHLLSLLLTSRQDFDTAGQSCVAAFEQFRTSTVLFGSGQGRSASKQNQLEKPVEMGLVDDMESDELQTIIELRLTELSLTELADGPEDAVNSSNDLLALYSRLFGHLGVAAEEKVQPKALLPPSSSAGTIKSFRGSLFHRKRVTSTTYVNEKANGVSPTKASILRPQIQTTQAPTIKVTDEDAKPSPHRHHLFRHSRDSSRLEKRKSQSTINTQQQKPTPRKLARSPSRERRQPAPRASVASSRQSFETSQDGPRSSTGTVETARPHLSPILSAEEVPQPSTPPTMAINNTENENTPIGTEPLSVVAHKLAAHNELPPPARHDAQPPEQDTRLPSDPSARPISRFPRTAAQKHALTILIKIWLVIAKLYRRASMFDESREATDEAAKAALKIESLIASVESSARAFADPGWGGSGKSSDEIWADVCCERGECALSMAMARAEVDEKEAQKNNPQHANTPRDGQAQQQHTLVQVDSEGVREAVDQFEQCLMYFPNHPGGIVALSNVLLDYYERRVELGRKVDDGKAKAEIKRAQIAGHGLGRGIRVGGAGQRGHGQEPSTSTYGSTGLTNGVTETGHGQNHAHLFRAETGFVPTATPDDDLRKTPENLNRLAARDRAYGLLSTLTKMGPGWDNSEAWYALARATELSGEIERAKELLWYVVELEDTRPLRHWSNVNVKGYVL